MQVLIYAISGMYAVFCWISGPTIGKQLNGKRQTVHNHSTHLLRSLNSVFTRQPSYLGTFCETTSVHLIGRLPFEQFQSIS